MFCSLSPPPPPPPLRTRDVYSRVLKHSGDKVHPRIHPAFAEPLADAKVSDLSSPEAVELVLGTHISSSNSGTGSNKKDDDDDNNNSSFEGGGEGGVLSPSSPFRGLDWLHPSGTSDHAKGVSVVAVVDPTSRKGLGTLEQVWCVLISGVGWAGSMGRNGTGDNKTRA